jgi:hypothetical protein
MIESPAASPGEATVARARSSGSLGAETCLTSVAVIRLAARRLHADSRSTEAST